MTVPNLNTALENNHKLDTWPDFPRSHYGVFEALREVIETRDPVEIVNWIAPKLKGIYEDNHIWSSLMASGDERLEKIGTLCKLIFNVHDLMGTAEFNQRDADKGGSKICIERDWPEPEICFHTDPYASQVKAEKAKQEAIPLVAEVLTASVSPDVFTDFWGSKALVEEVLGEAAKLVNHQDSVE